MVKLQHPLPVPYCFNFDQTEYEMPWTTECIMAVNLMTYRNEWETYSEFLLVEKTAPGDFRRLGCFRYCIDKEDTPTEGWQREQWETDLRSSMTLVKTVTLKEVQRLVPDMEWELQERAVRLI